MQMIPLADVERMGNTLARSGLFGIKSPEQALALMLVAQAEGQHPATVAQDYDIIHGRAARKTHSVLARFQAAGGRVEWHALTDTKAEATFSHPQGVARIEWTLDQAKRAGLTGKDNWKNFPRAMLRARCIAEGVRATYPAAIGGMMVSEEARDHYGTAAPQPARNMGQAVEIVDPDSPLLLAGKSAAQQGTAQLQAWWKDLSKDDRRTLAPHLETLKAQAAEADTVALPAPTEMSEVAE